MNNNKNQREIPAGVKVISIFYYIQAAFSFFYIIFVLLITNVSFASLNIILIESLFFVVMAVCIIVGVNFHNGKNWSRIAIIILGVFVVIILTYFMIKISQFMYLPPIIIEVSISAYLIFSKKVKQYFKE